MQVKKITIGFVTQVFDTDLKRFISQKFTTGDECNYEGEKGEAIEPDLLEVDGRRAYLPYDMVQPEA
jgi:hypothetical protein